MYTPAELDISVERNTTFNKTIIWQGSNLFGWTAVFKIYQGKTLALQDTNTTIGNPDIDTIYVKLSSAEISTLAPGRYTYRLDVVNPSNETYRILKGPLKVI